MTQQTSRDQRNALHRITEAVVATVNQTPQGAPGGALYTALLSYMSYDQFEVMMRLLAEIGRITKRGHLYFPAGSK